jgi:hypothetical protein
VPQLTRAIKQLRDTAFERAKITAYRQENSEFLPLAAPVLGLAKKKILMDQ